MNRRRPPSRYCQPSYAQQFPQQGPHFLQPPLPIAPIPQGCYYPPTDYYYYHRFPGYPAYPQMTYPSLPLPQMNFYRMSSQMNTIPAPVALPSFPPGYARPPQMSQPFLLHPNNPTQSGVLSHFDQLVGQAKDDARERDVPGSSTSDTNHMTTSASCIPENKPKDRRDTSTKSKACSSRSSRRSSSSRRRPRYSTKFRCRKPRRRNLKMKKGFGSRSSFSVTEVSSIRKQNDSDLEYETCDEKGNVHKADEAPGNYQVSDWLSDGKPRDNSTSGELSATLLTDYTIITNDKSYSYVNFNPEMLPEKLNRVWLEPQLSTVETQVKYRMHMRTTSANDAKCKLVVNKKSRKTSIASNVQENFGKSKECWDQANDSEENWDLQDSLSKSPSPKSPRNKQHDLRICKLPCNDHNNNKKNRLLDKANDLWWDDSTDVGCASAAQSSKSSENSGRCSVLNPPMDEMNLVKTVLNESFETIAPENTVVEAVENIVAVASRSLETSGNLTALSYAQSSKDDRIVDVKQINSNWKLTAVTHQDLDFSGTSAKNLPEEEKVEGKDLSKADDQDDERAQSKPFQTERGDPFDEDEAIVAVIHTDLLPSGMEEDILNPSTGSYGQKKQEKKFEEGVLNHQEENCKQKSQSQSSWSLPCSPASRSVPETEKLIRSYSSGVVELKSKSSPSPERMPQNRVCTPHSKIFVKKPFSGQTTSKSFSLLSNSSRFDNVIENDQSVSVAGDGIYNAEAREEQRCSDQAESRESKFMGKQNGSLTNEADTASEKETQLLRGSMSCQTSSSDLATKTFIKLTTPKGYKPLSEANVREPVLKAKTNFEKAFTCPQKQVEEKKASFVFSVASANPLDTYSMSKTFSYSNLSADEMRPEQFLQQNTQKNNMLTSYVEKVANNIAHTSSDAVGPLMTGSKSSRSLTSTSLLLKDDNAETNCASARSCTLHSDLPSAKVAVPVSKKISFSDDTTTPTVEMPMSQNNLQSSVSMRTEAVTCVSTTYSNHLEPNNSLFVTHDRVQCNIKSKVQDLMRQTSQNQVNSVLSPCLAALQGSGMNRNRCNVFFHKSVALANRNLPRTSRSASAPTSPCAKRRSISESFQRSVSLSDVFYDSTVNESTSSFNSLQFASTIFMSDGVELLSASKLSDDASIKMKEQRSTYVSYPLPWMTPSSKSNPPEVAQPATDDGIDEHPSPSRSAEEEPKALLVQKESALPSKEANCESNSDGCPSQELDQSTEVKLRESARDLIDSISIDQDSLKRVAKPRSSGILPSSKDHDYHKSLPLNFDSCLNEEDLKSEANEDDILKQSNSESNTSIDQPIISKTEEQIATVPVETLCPPKKPPRCKSPKSIEDQRSKRVEEVKVASNAAKETRSSGDPPFLSYFPMLSVARPSTKTPFYVAPTFLPSKIGQHMLRGPCMPAISWCALPPFAPSQRGKPFIRYVEKSKEHREATNSGFISNDFLDNLTDSSVKDASAEEQRQIKESGHLPHAAEPSVVPCFLIPYQPFAREDRLYPALQRRRSFSGIGSSASVARARLNRRRVQMQSTRPYCFNPAKQRTGPQLNASHPLAKRIRRPRFVRSSLSEHTISEAIPENEGDCAIKTDMTNKISRDRPMKAKQAEQQEEYSQIKPDNADAETGYCSSVSPEEEVTTKIEKIQKHAGKGSSQTVTTKKKKKIADKSLERRQVKSMEKFSQRSSKKSKLMTIPRTLKKILPGKKSCRNSNPFQISGLGDHNVAEIPIKQSNSDSKLHQQEVGVHHYTGKDHVRALFKSRKVYDTEEESTLKAVTTPSSSTNQIKSKRDDAKETSTTLAPKQACANIPPTASELNGSNSGDFTNYSAVDGRSNQGSVSAPGARINSETGDVIPEEKTSGGPTDARRHHQLLSSTAIDES